MKKFLERLLFCVTLLLIDATTSYAWFGSNEVVDKKCFSQVAESVGISDADVKRYKKAFGYIKKEKFEKANEVIGEIENHILMGHLLAEKYLSKKYKSSYDELRIWLEEYSDHPQAYRIYSLAIKRGDINSLVNPYNDGGKRYASPYGWYNEDYDAVSPKNAKFIRQQVNKFRRHINKGKTKMAKSVLEDAKFRKVIPNKNYDDMSATLALAYLMDNEDTLAIKWVEKAVKRSGNSTAAWVGGLASWRKAKYEDAAYYFSRLGEKEEGDYWLISAGAYWAYRSYLKLDDEKKANKWLDKAAVYQRTFYGILANYQLDRTPDYDWDTKSYLNDFSDYAYVDDIIDSPVMKRAIILVNAGQEELAERDLRRNYEGMNEKQQEIALYMSQQFDMHSLGITLSNCLRDYGQNRYYDSIAYPAPDWKPDGGWQVDKSLVLALVRQESAFYPLAVSGAGATGLMQLMPRTALHVARNNNLNTKGLSLTDVGYNLSMGQTYVNYLLDKPFIDGNLFFLTVAYNAGPGNLLKWQKRMNYNDDPLLFIEVVPARETRLYIKRVVANYWIYSMKFGEKSETLGQVARGEWPKVGR